MFLFYLMLLLSFPASSQDTLKIIPLKYGFFDRKIKPVHSLPFIFPTPKTISYYNYPLTSNEIIRRENGKVTYNRVYNAITNNNHDGFFGNLLGVPRIQKPRNTPGF